MNKRVESVDVLRGLTMAFMLVVDNPGGPVYTPLDHAQWNGFTPTDFVFPTFVFVMGVSMYLSMSKSGFKLSWKVLKRFLLLLGIGILINWISKCVWNKAWMGFETVRLSGVLVRLALCYGLSALIVCLVNEKWLGWIVTALLVGYGALLLLGNGYSEGTDSILYKVDSFLIGQNHMYMKGKVIDPEGICSTLPAVAHTLIGFLVGNRLANKEFRKMDAWGTALLAAGLLLMWWMPLNKKVWSPTFVLVACGMATLLLSLFHYLIDEKGLWKHTAFWKVFGSNAILCYLLCDVVVWVMHLTGWHSGIMQWMGVSKFTSLVYALGGMLLIYLIVRPLYKRKIFIRL